MIIIYYQYWNKTLEQWKDAEKEFNDIEKAIRFCWSMKNNDKMSLTGFKCFDSEDRYIMERRVNVGKINGWW